ncbi:MAG TPA: rhodanese-like domain-containing protein [Bauldia sp.]|nr:rhodanese-like domain-containing protein [Bauldia sp.]
MSGSGGGNYAGDVGAREAFAALASEPGATLVDVRTRAEWTYVGVPALGEIGKQTVLVEWDDFSTGQLVPDFIGRLSAELEKRGVSQDAPLYFICRSGNRSRNAAIAATAAGYSKCFNIEFGFEGRLGPDRHRGTAGSWKAEGLPWVQS